MNWNPVTVNPQAADVVSKLVAAYNRSGKVCVFEAMWAPKFTLRANDSLEVFEYDERDECYAPEGWYHCECEYCEAYWIVSDYTIVAWADIPEFPEEFAK